MFKCLFQNVFLVHFKHFIIQEASSKELEAAKIVFIILKSVSVLNILSYNNSVFHHTSSTSNNESTSVLYLISTEQMEMFTF